MPFTDEQHTQSMKNTEYEYVFYTTTAPNCELGQPEACSGAVFRVPNAAQTIQSSSLQPNSACIRLFICPSSTVAWRMGRKGEGRRLSGV